MKWLRTATEIEWDTLLIGTGLGVGGFCERESCATYGY